MSFTWYRKLSHNASRKAPPRHWQAAPGAHSRGFLIGSCLGRYVWLVVDLAYKLREILPQNLRVCGPGLVAFLLARTLLGDWTIEL